jgi:hypothetical protein
VRGSAGQNAANRSRHTALTEHLERLRSMTTVARTEPEVVTTLTTSTQNIPSLLSTTSPNES